MRSTFFVFACCFYGYILGQYSGGNKDGGASSVTHGVFLSGQIAALTGVYSGGSSDGASIEERSFLLDIVISFYVGGLKDGYDNYIYSATLSEPIDILYSGAHSDGYDTKVMAVILGSEPSSLFQSGDGDGHANDATASTFLIELANLYYGGGGDGNDLISDNFSINGQLHIFYGGIGNGHASASTQGILSGSHIIYGGGQGDGSSSAALGNYLVAVLPVELLYFIAKQLNSGVQLSWATASEHNNDYFKVLRSKDGNEFEILTTIDGAGNSSFLLEYGYQDINPYDGINYYQLHQWDFDGQSSFSEIVSVYTDFYKDDIVVYPNPVENGLITIKLSGRKSNESIHVILNDLTARKISDLDTLNGSQIRLPDTIESGTYMLIISVGHQQWQRRIIVK